MAAIIAAITAFFVMCNDGFSFFKSIFGKSTSDNTEDAATKAVAMSNEAGKLSADVSRDTEKTLNVGLENATSQNSSAVDAVRNADSVRDQQTAVDDAIARANQDTDSHG